MKPERNQVPLQRVGEISPQRTARDEAGGELARRLRKDQLDFQSSLSGS